MKYLPELNFLVIDMPGLNGFQRLAELKMHEALNKTPVVIYSSSFHSKDMEKDCLNGTNLYLTERSSIQEIRASFLGILALG